MKTKLRIGMLLMTFIISGNIFASTGSIKCETPRKNKVFNINNESIAIIQNRDNGPQRTLASVTVRTNLKGKGFTKVMNFEGNKYFIHIDNTKSFSEVNDYVYIKTPRGHQMTYPLICSKG